jgi:hypothetical protein
MLAGTRSIPAVVGGVISVAAGSAGVVDSKFGRTHPASEGLDCDESSTAKERNGGVA